MVAVAIPEFDAESAFDGTLADRWERELRWREDSAGMLCLFLCQLYWGFLHESKSKIKIKKNSLSFHVASQQVRALERFPAIFDTALEERFSVMIGFMTSARTTLMISI